VFAASLTADAASPSNPLSSLVSLDDDPLVSVDVFVGGSPPIPVGPPGGSLVPVLSLDDDPLVSVDLSVDVSLSDDPPIRSRPPRLS
jgi:hypothetical protein